MVGTLVLIKGAAVFGTLDEVKLTDRQKQIRDLRKLKPKADSEQEEKIGGCERRTHPRGIQS